MKDLSAPLISSNADQHTKIELLLPFAKTHMVSFIARLTTIGKMKETDTLTLEELAQLFNSQAWSDLQVSQSQLAKLITSKIFLQDSPQSSSSHAKISIKRL